MLTDSDVATAALSTPVVSINTLLLAASYPSTLPLKPLALRMLTISSFFTVFS